MASVYKTLSKTDSHEKEPGEKRNKQRVLILVGKLEKVNAPLLTNIEFKRCHIQTSPSAAGSVLFDVSDLNLKP